MKFTYLTTLTLLFLFTASTRVSAQQTKKVISYSKNLGDSRIMILRSDNTLWWYAPKKNWTAVPKTGLPDKATILDVEVYLKPVVTGSEIRLITLLSDNTLWWYVEGKNWELLECKGLPASARIKDITVYLKPTGFYNDPCIVALMEDGALWYFVPKKQWEKVPLDGLGAK
jgi:hypothetical protein